MPAFRRALLTLLAAAGLSLVPVLDVRAVAVPSFVLERVEVGVVVGEQSVPLPVTADFAVVSWDGGEADAPQVAWSADGDTYAAWQDVGHDEILSRPEQGRTSSAVLVAPGARSVRLRTDQPLRGVRLSLLDSVTRRVLRVGSQREAAAAAEQPDVVRRSEWGANEAWRPSPPTYAPVQKLVVHHTASEPGADAAAYVRAVQAFHVNESGFSDIGYQFLIDDAGVVYEGRYARDYAAGETPTGESAQGESVIGAHVGGTNTGLVGIALLGDLTARQPSAAQRAALVEVLAWESERHAIDPVGSALYVGSSGNRTFPNIAGHREAALPSGPTACPGDAFYPTLPQLRLDVAARVDGGQLVPVSPTRLLDTRGGLAVTPEAPVTVDVGGRASVPSGAAAAVLNVTAVNGNATSHLTVYPAGTTRPLASTLNFAPRTVVPNLTMARLGEGDAVVVHNAAGAVHVLVDLVGWYVDSDDAPPPDAGELTTLPAPVRLLDTRTPAGGGALAGGDVGSRALPITGVQGIPAEATAVVLNVTVDKPTAGTAYLTVYPDGEARPTASNLNFVRGQTVPNLVVVKVGGTGAVRLFTNTGSTHVVVDAVAWFEPDPTDARFVDAVPTRILDTRGGTADGFTAAVGAGQTIHVPVRGRGGVPRSAKAVAVVLNVTVTQPTMSGFLTVWPSGVLRPGASNLNYAARQTIANLVVSRVGSDGTVAVYNPRGSTHVIFDVVGWYVVE